MTWRIALVAAPVLLLALPATAAANRVNIGHTTISGHRISYCTWNPLKARVHPYVQWSKHTLHTVRYRATHSPRSICAINGDTYNADAPRIPVGPVRARGRWVTRHHRNQPVFGFMGRRVIFGWEAIHRHHPANVMAGKAYLVMHGVPITRHRQAPWTTPSQFFCGDRGTDGWYGCFRSAAVRFKNGRVGLVSIALASMPEAGAVLKRMGVVTAVTGDSGGGEEYWAGGQTFQTIPNAGKYASWRRRIPDAVILAHN